MNNTDIKNQDMNLKNGDHLKTIHAAMHAGYYHNTQCNTQLPAFIAT